MGKSSKKSATKVGAAPVVVAKDNNTAKKGKRGAGEVAAKVVNAKKQILERDGALAAKKNLEAKNVKKKEETSESDDSEVELDEEPPKPKTPVATVVSSPDAVPVQVVEKAVKALLQWKDSNSKSKKPQLLSPDSDEFLYLVVSLKKIPPKGRTNPYKIPLPHPLFSPSIDGDGDASELCLFLDDRPDRRPNSKDAKAKITSEGIPIPKVIKFSKLKTDYKPFEAKRKLCDSYDLFLSDRRIIPLLPKILGKQFFKKKKIPVAIDLEHQNWKEQVERVCGSAMLHLKTGTCSSVRVARASMEAGDIVENLVAVINGVADTVPRKWKNLRSLHLKFSDSLALPIYQSAPEASLKITGMVKMDDEVREGKKRGREEGEDGLSSNLGKKSSSKKGRIHEVRYMDDATESLSGEENDSDTEEKMVVNRISHEKEEQVEGKKKSSSKKAKRKVK